MLFKKSKNAGFSLVELMVVVAIIGILAALAVPKLAKFRALAYAAGGKTDLASIATMMELYLTQNGSYSAATLACGTATAICASPDDNNIGFTAVANRKYGYTLPTLTSQTYRADATNDQATNALGSCQTADHTMTMNQDRELNAPVIPGCG